MSSTRRVTLRTGPLEFSVLGSGWPLVYRHPTSRSRVSGALTMLGSRYEIFAPVLPGFDGRERHPAVTTVSDLAGVVAEFIHRVAGGYCALLGHSFGAWVAAATAGRAPRAVPELVLEAPTLGYAPSAQSAGDPNARRAGAVAPASRPTLPAADAVAGEVRRRVDREN